MSWFTRILLLLLIYRFVQAKVARDITAEEDFESSNSKRTLFSIVWGCVTTTFICAWVAIHLNIATRDSPFERSLRRLDLMFWTILVPPIFLCWALNQLLAAITVRDVYNYAKGYGKKKSGICESVRAWFSMNEIKGAASPVWTIAHGHFLIMGGFHVVEPPEDGPQSKEAITDTQRADPESGGECRETILTLEMLRELVKDQKFDIRITEDEISDRSKSDALSKLIFSTQSTWFILRCLGRWIQKLDLTQFELATLALASLNGITFALWWAKPLGTQTIVRVYLNRKLTDSERVRVGKRSMRSRTIHEVPQIIKKSTTIIRNASLCQCQLNLTALITIPFAIILLLLSPFFAFASFFFATASDLLEGTSTSFPPDAARVPTLYFPKNEYSRWLQILFISILSAIYGGIHCAGWHFAFPTYAEQTLWRVASLFITIFPIVVFPLGQIATYPPPFQHPTADWYPYSYKHLRLAVGTIIILGSFAYMAARLILLGLTFSLLRHIPPNAFIAVNWTRFYPHIF